MPKSTRWRILFLPAQTSKPCLYGGTAGGTESIFLTTALFYKALRLVTGGEGVRSCLVSVHII